jgi:rhodanese-related sulfurtransferase
MVNHISAERAQELIAAGEVDVVDVREIAEWQTGHMPAARHVALSRLRLGAKPYLTRDKVLFVCAAGMRSNMAAQLASSIGLTEVYNLVGGTRAWVTAGLPLVKPVASAVG